MLNFEITGTLADTKFKNTVKSVVRFADNQLIKYHDIVDDKKSVRYHEIHSYIEEHLNKMYSKRGLVCDLMDLIYRFPIKAPMIRKRVKDYFDMQINAYSLGERPYTNAIAGYPYKSNNIVDLLDEVEAVRKERYECGLSRQQYNDR